MRSLPPLEVSGRKPHSPRTLPKVYPRLQTLTQLTGVYVAGLHTGDFVARSQERWKNFDGLNALNSARDRTISTVKQSAALVIQSSWRRHAAGRERERLKTRVWRRQLEIAARISQHSSSLTQALELQVTDCLQSVACCVPICGFYLHAPALLLSWWLGFSCAQLAAERVLRSPPIVVRAVDVYVRLTMRKLSQLWRWVVPLAALKLQLCVRMYLARRKVGKLRRQRLELQAARRLQTFVRVYYARHAAKRLIRWCAVLRLQCFWRCVYARKHLQQRRVTWIATSVCTLWILQAARQATIEMRVRSARTVQKQYRGCRARLHFQELLSRQEEQKWRRNPSKGLDFFQLKRYDQAALYLENCFRQGIFAEELTKTEPVMDQSARQTKRKLMSGSRMSFSFSAAPTKLGSDWVRSRADDSRNDAGLVAGRLQFWQAYALSHFLVFEATGDAENLKQARVGWESYLQVDEIVRSWVSFRAIVASLRYLRFRSQFELVRCLFWSGKDGEKALSLSLRLLQKIDRSQLDAGNVEAKLLMISGMLYFEQNLLAASCAQLEKLLVLSVQSAFTDLEVRFTLALVLLRRYEEGSGDTSEADEAEMNSLLRTATQLLKQCFRVVELWPSVGFYHGEMKKHEAKRFMTKEPVGSFLLYQPIDPKATEKTVLLVKLSDRIASMRIEFTDSGVYKTRKMADHQGHFSLHGLVAKLPPEAGVQMEFGIRKSLFTRSLQKEMERFHSELLQEKVSLRLKLLNWDEWGRKLDEIAAKTDKKWKRRNETWSAVCLEVAKALECSEAWVFAEFAAHEALLHSKDRSQRAISNFLAARVALNRQERNESALFMQQARLEAPTVHSIPNLSAVQRAWSLNVSISRQEPFSSRLERLQKLERLCLKAWRYDSLAGSFRGDPFREALLLQRVSDEVYAECGDTFFIRSLLKAHVRAYVGDDSWYEGLHLKCAYDCVALLFKRFQEHQESWTVRLENLTDHFQGITTTGKKSRCFNVKLLLLSWHHIPFVLCFEMAEVLYRYKSHKASTLIDVYESLQGRLRGSQAQSFTYAAYEELILLRLAFLHVGRVSQTDSSWRHLNAAVAAMDELLELRKFRTSETVKKAKRIQWPCSIYLPFSLTEAELLFIRGFYHQFQEDLMKIPTERRSSWRDFHPLHQQLIEIVKKSAPGEVSGRGGLLNSMRYRSENLQGLRVFIGATHDVSISNMLRSQPFVAIRVEGTTKITKSPPTWTNLSPSWEEDMEIQVSSARSNVVISVMNRMRRNSRWQDADTVGYVSIAMQELLAAHDGVTEGKYYELTMVKPLTKDKPRIFLGFQVIVKPQSELQSSVKRTAKWATRSGNWDVEDVRAHLVGDLQAFVANRWVWSRFASQFMQEKDFFITKWFYVKSVRLTTELQRRSSQVGVRLSTGDSLAIANDLVGLSYCYRYLSDAKWGGQAIPLLGQAEMILKRKVAQRHEGCSQADRASLDKQLTIVRQLLAAAQGTTTIGPLEEALKTKIAATSEWVKITSRGPSGVESRYFNQDTGETFHSVYRNEPVEYEDKELLVEQERLPHRIVVMKSDMKHRVKFHRQELLRLHSEDPFQWVAVFNDQKKEFQFYSPHSAETYSDLNGRKQPPTYVMLADEFLLYHVLLVQDSYRKYHRRRQRERRLRGVLLSACFVSRVLLETRRKMNQQSLNCVLVTVEKAQHLRSADLLSSDPFVKLALTDPTGEEVATGETSVRYNSLNPKWNEEFHFRYRFTDHEEQRVSGKAEAALTLKVFDYDVVSTGKEEDSGNNGDFLGLATIPIRTFSHGKKMSADLLLMDENGGTNSPGSRGTLTVSVHWAHCGEEENVAKLWAIGSGGGRGLFEKDRPELPHEAALAIDVLRQQMERLLDLLLGTAAEVLEPVLRLQNRLKVAQAKGKTAEEAKMLELRFQGLVQTQLLPKVELVRKLVAGEIDLHLPIVLKKLIGPVDEYVSSFGSSSRRDLRSTMEKCLDNLNIATYSLKKSLDGGISPAEIVNLALSQHQLVNSWNEQLREILETFFINAQWQFILEEKVNELYAKLSDDSPGSREGKVAKRPDTAVTKRKERIEKAKQEKAWYEV